MPSPPPPPPPALPVGKMHSAPLPVPEPPFVEPAGSPGSFLVELIVYNGAPFKDHWAFWVASNAKSSVGVLLNAAGDVKDGFRFEISRSHDFDASRRIPLQWVEAKHFDEKAMFNHGRHTIDHSPVCEFEASAHKVKAPGKSLNPIGDEVIPGKKLTQRNCQTWIVEAAEQLVEDGIFSVEVTTYLEAARQ